MAVKRLKREPKSVADLVRIIYSGLDERLRHLARNQVLSHLIKLENEDRVSASGQLYRVKDMGGTRIP